MCINYSISHLLKNIIIFIIILFNSIVYFLLYIIFCYQNKILIKLINIKLIYNKK